MLEIESILKTHKDVLAARFHVKCIGVFGSYARNEETRGSDVDILVEFSEPVGWELFDLKDYLEEILEKPVDIVTKNALKRQLRSRILEEVRMV
ncbi:MAG: nucleotidyltransferase family protein [Candidatus Latescibacter sp.]|nr:nucleotidyltransferase family protein [Candidatus Latescibacter sp.]